MVARLFRPLVALIVSLTVSACGGSSSPTQPAPSVSQSPQTYLEALIGVMESSSVHRLTINWADFRARVMAEAENAQTIPDTFPAIRTALTLLNDGHSAYVPASGGPTIFVRTRSCAAPAAPAPDVPADIGYVKVTSFSGTADEALAYANRIQDTIRATDRDGLAGWIVDLRGNGGGNMWPMIAGLGPIVGEGLLGYFVRPVGGAVPWGYREGTSWSGSNHASAQTVTSPYRLRQPDPAVAVLIDGRVASSGEAATIAFKQRARTRFFGASTCGLSTANASFGLSDGASLVLAVALMADRTRKEYGDIVAADEVVTGAAQTVDRAIAWLRNEA